MDKIFYVQKEGVFPQGVSAVRTTLPEAINEAVRLCEADVDSHHVRVVYEASLGPGALPCRDPLFATDRNNAPRDIREELDALRPYRQQHAD